jgi:xylono-1,5-lactonase
VDFELVADGFGALEAPVIADDGTITVSDLKRGAVFSVTHDGGCTRLFDRPHVGGLAPHRSGGLVASGVDVAHWQRGLTRTVITLDQVRELGIGDAVGFNDLTADPLSGAVIVGVLCQDGDGNPTPGVLVRLDPSGGHAVVASDLHPNGLAFTADGRSLVAADTYGRRVLLFDVAASGHLDLSRVFPLSDVPGLPDGLALDRSGGVWIAFYKGGCIVRLDTESGETTVHETPFSKPLSVGFGPAGAGRLVVVSGRHPEAGEPSGGIWVSATAIEGEPTARAAV